jgi:DNA-binding transcriptional LysR family regulator
MIPFDLRQLRQFVAVAEELHFGRAAERLRIAQPALTQVVQRLEREFGTPLLDRTNRRVRLTDAGGVLLEHARRLLADADEALQAVQRAGRGETGSVVAAYAGTGAFLQVPALVRRFIERRPAVHVDLRAMSVAAQTAALRARQIDVGFMSHPVTGDDLRSAVVVRGSLLIAIGRTHRLASLPKITLRDLKDERFIIFPGDVAWWDQAEAVLLCQEAGFTPETVQASRELFSSLSYVQAGVGVSIVPSSITHMEWPDVRFEPIDSPRAESHIAAVWHRENRRPVVREFLASALDAGDGGTPGEVEVAGREV